MAWKVFCTRCALLQIGLGPARLIFCGLLLVCSWLSVSLHCVAAEKTVRVRFAWGSGTAAKQRWTGTISIEGGVLTQLQPLGIETDAPVALRIDGSRLIVAPLEKRGFDGCDITVRADEQAQVRVELRNEQTPQPIVFESPLAKVITNQMRQPLDALGSFFLAHRSPGDQLRVLPTREHLVFEPGETWKLRLLPDVAAELKVGPVLLDVQLRAAGEDKPSWQSSQQISEPSQLETGLDFEIVCPQTEGAYRLTVTARPEEGFATRFVPGQQARPIATRDVEFVVIDPTAKLPPLVDHWLPVLTIDPANPRWWQRLPAWAQVRRLRERSSGATGNVRPLVRPTPNGELVELPSAAENSDPYWQAYTLPVSEPGKPHLVEIEYPLDAKQNLAIALVEPDAAGRVTTTQQGVSLFNEGSSTAGGGEVGVHRFVIWPRTRSPQLLLVNRHPTAPVQYGKIKLSKQDSAFAGLADAQTSDNGERLVAGYLAKPQLTDNFGAAEWLDVESGLSVQSWSTFLDATRRLAQTLRLGGYNGVLISVAADGSAIYPSRIINPSTRYDTGLLAASGQDPTRKDVLEMLLRVFDREGIRVVPTVQMATPLPRLETLRLASDSRVTGIGCIGHSGRTWLAENSTNNGLAPFYNPLNDRVQAELAELVGELTSRYGKHVSLAGVGVQLSGEGYGMLPGLAWGFDDSTVAEFSRATGVTTPRDGEQRFGQRANALLGEHRQVWQKWRQEKISKLYAQLAQQLAAERSDLRLILTTEDVFAGPELQQRVRQAIADPIEFGEILHDHGIDLEQLNAHAGICTLTPHRLSAVGHLQERAIDLRITTAVEQGELLSDDQRTAELLFQTSRRFRLPSFDEQSLFGAEQTFLTVTSQSRPAGPAQRRPLITAFAGNDATTVVLGGLQLESNSDAQTREILRTVRQLPNTSAEMQTQRQQPVVMRVYRTGQATTVALINESPWPVQAEVALTGSRPSDWLKLGRDIRTTDSQPSSGTFTEVEQSWQVELQPYDLQAWRFNDEKLRVGELNTSMTDVASQELGQRIQEIESRAGNLNIERAYPQLQNPGFELEDNGVRIVGWQPRLGALGAIGLDTVEPHSGSHSLRLSSADATGVALQSHLFLAPDTGQLMVSFFLRIDQLDDAAQLQIAVQSHDEGGRYRQFASLGKAQLADQGWSRYELALGDVPSGTREQLRLHFHLTGKAEVLVDDVQLYDLRFDDARRLALVKRIYAAKKALEQGQVVDCLRMVDDYWSRYLVEFVPPTASVTFQATKQSPVTQSAASEKEARKENQGIRSRLPGWVPRIWR